MLEELNNKVRGLAFREPLFLQASCIALLSASSTAVFPLRQHEWVVVDSLSTSCGANVCLALTCALYRSAETSAVVLKRETVPKGLLIRSPHAWGKASMVPILVGTSRVAPCHGALFSLVLISKHSAVRYCDRW